jgi:Tol biopolymer transport system component
MMALKRIADPQISPDGRWVAFSVQTVDLGANKKPTQIWIVPLDGGAPRQITQDGDDNERPRWSPDSRRIAYVSNRGGSSQIWLMDPDGSNANGRHQLRRRSRWRPVFARWQEPAVHQRRLSRVRRRRCLQ